MQNSSIVPRTHGYVKMFLAINASTVHYHTAKC
jgi:hypothetical protein